MYEGFREDFLQANANKEFIGAQFTEVVRHLMRAIGATSTPDYAISRAAEQMQFVLELLQRTEEHITFRDLFAQAAANLGDIPPRGDRLDDMVDAAQIGISLIAELTCADNTALARASKRENEFFSALKGIADSHPAFRRR
ncbi:MAG: hypothetical protein ACFCUT_06835 [Kiloniellaceae bacterium]